MIKYVELKCRFENGEFPSRIVELTLPITAIHRLQIENNKYYALIHGTEKDKGVKGVIMKDKAKEFLNALENAHEEVTKESIGAFHDELMGLSPEEVKKKKAEILQKSLKYDPLAEAERTTGCSYKEDGVIGNMVTGIGMELMWKNGAVKNKLLKERKDTLFSNTLEYYLEVIESNGFEWCLEIPFESCWGGEDRFYIFWHPDGILLSFDTFNRNTSINGGKIYYNWTSNSKKAWSSGCLSSHSGSFKCKLDGKEVSAVSGSHDAREALIYNIDRLREEGTLLNPWKQQGFLWLLHYMDHKDINGNSKDYDYKAITKERISLLPKHVQEAIKGDK